MINQLMTVGELAKKMQTTVRTLQYYDRIGLLKPSEKSEGGRRLYCDSDILKLFQIFSLKELGFSLDDIKHKMMTLNDSQTLFQLLDNQDKSIDRQMLDLHVIQLTLRDLKNDIQAGKMPDYEKYAAISVKLREYHKNVEMMDGMDGPSRDVARNLALFESEKADRIYQEWNRLSDELAELVRAGILPESDAAQQSIEKYWEMVMEFTGGDLSILPSLYEFNQTSDQWDDPKKQRQELINDFVARALEIYFAKNQMVPPGFEEDNENEQSN